MVVQRRGKEERLPEEGHIGVEHGWVVEIWRSRWETQDRVSKGTEMGDTFCRMKRDNTEWSRHESDLSVCMEKKEGKEFEPGNR